MENEDLTLKEDGSKTHTPVEGEEDESKTQTSVEGDELLYAVDEVPPFGVLMSVAFQVTQLVSYF